MIDQSVEPAAFTFKNTSSSLANLFYMVWVGRLGTNTSTSWERSSTTMKRHRPEATANTRVYLPYDLPYPVIRFARV